MSIQFEHIKKDALTTSTWSGGTTTQLAIYPKGSVYKNRDFNWRISSATVETEVSTFTSLPGITRYITTLSGTLKLEHKNYHSVSLNPFEVDCFDGAWETTSFGQVTDFNLMLSRGTYGVLRTKKLTERADPYTIQFEKLQDIHSKRTLGLYAATAPLTATVSGRDMSSDNTFSLQTGDLLLVTADTDFNGIHIQTNHMQSYVCIIEVSC